MKPFKHHPLIEMKGSDVLPIKCSSREEMERIFGLLASHYGAKVVPSHGRDSFAVPIKIQGQRSRAARDQGIHYTPWRVVKHEFLLASGPQWRVEFSQYGRYAASNEAVKACYPDGGWPE